MKIHLEHNEINLVFDVPQLIPKEDTEKIVSVFYDTLEKMVTPSPVSIKTKIEEVVKTPITPPAHEERPTFRDRLPNAIDVKDLDIKKAVTENALVRCPKCGQSHVLVVDTGTTAYMMRKFYSASGKNDEFRIVAEFDKLESPELSKMSCAPETDRKLYFEDIQTLPMLDDKDFVVNNDTEIFCPVCNYVHDFFEWKDAYDSPLNYFETEHLCDACGGETVTKVEKQKEYKHCEKCGLDMEEK